MGQRQIGFAIFLVKHDCVTVRKSTATHILTGKADRIALFQQRTVGKQFSHTPVQWQCATGHFAAIVINFADLTLHLYAIGNINNFAGDSLQIFKLQTCIGRSAPVVAQVRLPVDKQTSVRLANQVVYNKLAFI